MRLRLWNIVKSRTDSCQKYLARIVSSSLSKQSYSTLQNKVNYLRSLSSKLSSLGIAKKIQYVIATCIAVFIFGSAVYFVNQIYALTLYFTQSDWSGGADTNATINSSNSTGWTKFYSNTAGIDNSTAGEIKLKLESSP